MHYQEYSASQKTCLGCSLDEGGETALALIKSFVTDERYPPTLSFLLRLTLYAPVDKYFPRTECASEFRLRFLELERDTMDR